MLHLTALLPVSGADDEKSDRHVLLLHLTALLPVAGADDEKSDRHVLLLHLTALLPVSGADDEKSDRHVDLTVRVPALGRCCSFTAENRPAASIRRSSSTVLGRHTTAITAV